MQKILKIIGMISALVLSALGLSACNRDEGEIISLYGVPSSYEDLKECGVNVSNIHIVPNLGGNCKH